MASKPMDIEPVNTATIAECFGCTQRRVQQLVTDGVIDAIKQGKVYRYDLKATIRKYIAYLNEDVPSDMEQGLAERKLRAEAEFRETKVAQEKLKLAELEGTMHRSDDVREATEQLVYAIRSMLVAFPGRLAVDVAAARTAPEAEQLIRAEVNAILGELAEFRYDPEVYAKMVRERQGWREVDSEEPDGED